MSSGSSMAKTFAANLRALRELRALTQAELGARAEMTAAAISHFETGNRLPSIESLVRLADALSVSVDFLLGRATADDASSIDPVFVAASRADARTLDAVRRVTSALLASENASDRKLLGKPGGKK